MNRNGASIHLPKPRTLDSPFTALVHARRSRYDFDPCGELSLASLGTLLGTALGLGRRVDAYGDREHVLSVAATAGGLRTRETYVLATRIRDVRPGIYSYDMPGHSLQPVSEEDPAAALSDVYVQPQFAALPAVSIALTARLDVALTKYPPRHYRTMHVDAGIAVQNLYLTATGLGLACCAVSGFSDPAAESVLGLDAAAIVTMLMAVGPPRTAVGPGQQSA
ncbi:SagB family peptide dehydrogenase [Rhodococcus fascians]|nr:SagB family peptide dehydrogenase [Rhodococcus fascians]MBY3999985.1 SagB family peptide dehydrogenase [Rhodococcus fascians]MBY4005168.1 SagB family peptide dehydrogenase [Rhodococcus fascians]MBY4010332.1 SagB family peptide dehydrogenase [Rhodococcus fascians]MBY4020383.1 SagB family peptide dehydrogenase [Rhodococcus fascians]